MSIYEYRLATREDAEAIFVILKEVACEIPVCLRDHKAEEKILEQVHGCCNLGSSWVALDHDHQIVGFLLAEPHERGDWYGDDRTLNLPYGGVKPGHHRGQGIFPALMEKLMANGVPLAATVKDKNKSEMVCRLVKLGFEEDDDWMRHRSDERIFLWRPPSFR